MRFDHNPCGTARMPWLQPLVLYGLRCRLDWNFDWNGFRKAVNTTAEPNGNPVGTTYRDKRAGERSPLEQAA
jgi:hypothetical protein